MKKSIFILALAFVFNLYAETSDFEKSFIKGNIQDKTRAVKEASDEEGDRLAKKGIYFILENKEIARSDRDFSALAVASLFKLSKDEKILGKNFPSATENLIQLFEVFEDETVRIAVLDKFENVSNSKSFFKVQNLMNGYLKELDANSQNSAVTKKVIELVGKTGNEESFLIVYRLWKEKKYPEFSPEIQNSLLRLSYANITESIKLISSSSIEEIGEFFGLINNSSEIPLNFKAEIAENALLATIHYMEDKSEKNAVTAGLQLKLLKAISDANWTRGAGLSVRFFAIAKDEYKNSCLNDEQFIQVIECIAKLSSPDAAQTISAYLAEINSETEKNNFSAQNVVLAVINSLGALGDKTAFDNLLYVTYLNYPEDVKTAARNSLAKLKW